MTGKNDKNIFIQKQGDIPVKIHAMEFKKSEPSMICIADIKTMGPMGNPIRGAYIRLIDGSRFEIICEDDEYRQIYSAYLQVLATQEDAS